VSEGSDSRLAVAWGLVVLWGAIRVLKILQKLRIIA
jgi:hypothetical protein